MKKIEEFGQLSLYRAANKVPESQAMQRQAIFVYDAYEKYQKYRKAAYELQRNRLKKCENAMRLFNALLRNGII